jgi:transglutaminase-like putative cysteine protease/tetratricopeptide (TPR) repeat protein
VGTALYVKNHDGAEPTQRVAGDWQQLEWLWRDRPAVVADTDTPPWFERYPSIEFSQFADWRELATAASALFAVSGSPPPELAAQIAVLRAAGTNDAKRALAVVRFVQEDVRYTGIENGDGAYRPSAPEVVLKRRFGDCKDKTLLAVTLLRSMGIEAAPVLVSTRWRAALASRLPSPDLMNHAIVRTRIDGELYWFDVTSTAQAGTLKQFTQSDLGAGLVVAPGVNDLETLPVKVPEKPLIEATSTFDLRQGLDMEADLTVTTVYRGPEADEMRRTLRSTTTEELGRSYLNYYKGRYPDVHSREPPQVHDDAAANELTVTESYGIEHLLTTGEHDAQQFDLNTALIGERLKAPDTPVRTMPLGLAYPTDVLERVDIRMPEDWNVKEDVTHIDGPGFRYESQAHGKGADIHLSYHYTTLSDHVDVTQITELLKKREQARQDTYFTLTYTPGTAPGAAEVTQALRDMRKAVKLVEASSLEKVDRLLQEILGSRGYRGLNAEQQHAVLLLAGAVALQRNDAARAQRLLMQSSSKEAAEANDWLMRLNAADVNRDAIDATRSLTTLASRWPEVVHQVNDFTVARAVRRTPAMSSAQYQLLKALANAHYERQDGGDLSPWWRDLGLLQLARGERTEAVATLRRVQEMYALISIRADNRFASVRAELGDTLNIDAAAQRHIDVLRTALSEEPAKLTPVLRLIEALYEVQRYEEALALTETTMAAAHGPAGPKTYADYGDRYVWLLDGRARLLQALGRWDEAVVQLTEASRLPESTMGNVSQVINLAGLLNDMGQPAVARDTLAKLGKDGTSPYGAMQVANEQLGCAVQLGDQAEVERQLNTLREHQSDSPSTLQRALVSANQLDEVAALLVSRLDDPEQRIDALLSVQQYASTRRAVTAETLWQRWQSVLTRPEIQQAIARVGTVESYQIRPQGY